VEVLADTSGLYALLDADDRSHHEAAKGWKRVLEVEADIVIHPFILLEVWTLLQARLGFEALETFLRDFRPLLTIRPVPEDVLERAMTRCRISGKRDLSLTDCTSLELARARGIRSAFAFDRHFREEGFLLPGQPSWPGPGGE